MKYEVRHTQVKRVEEFSPKATETWEVKVRHVSNVINEMEGLL